MLHDYTEYKDWKHITDLRAPKNLPETQILLIHCFHEKLQSFFCYRISLVQDLAHMIIKKV